MSHIRGFYAAERGAVSYMYRKSMEMSKNVVSWRQVFMKTELDSQPNAIVQISGHLPDKVRLSRDTSGLS